jgi:hypothetical protein
MFPAARPLQRLWGHLERAEVVIEPETPAGGEGLKKIRIGDISERLGVIPAKFRAIITRHPSMPIRAGTASSRQPHLPGTSKAAFPLKRFWRRSRCRNMPVGCRSTARQRSMPATGRDQPFADDAVDGQG